MKKRKNSLMNGVIKYIIQFKNVPKRVILFVLLSFLATYFYGKYFGHLISTENQISENQYFWLLGSYVQGFSAFTGIIIASIALGTSKNFRKKIDKLRLEKTFFMPIVTSLITILSSIIGIGFYQLLKNAGSLGLLMFITSFMAVWCMGEIFNLMIIFISKD